MRLPEHLFMPAFAWFAFDLKYPSHFACHFSGLANWGSQILACRAFGFGTKVAVKQEALGGHDLYG